MLSRSHDLRRSGRPQAAGLRRRQRVVRVERRDSARLRPDGHRTTPPPAEYGSAPPYGHRWTSGAGGVDGWGGRIADQRVQCVEGLAQQLGQRLSTVLVSHRSSETSETAVAILAASAADSLFRPQCRKPSWIAPVSTEKLLQRSLLQAVVAADDRSSRPQVSVQTFEAGRRDVVQAPGGHAHRFQGRAEPAPSGRRPGRAGLARRRTAPHACR